jgi:hypothetical protein
VDEGGIGILLHGGEELEEGIHNKKTFFPDYAVNRSIGNWLMKS